MNRFAMASLVAAAAGSAVGQTITLIPGFAPTGVSADGSTVVGTMSGGVGRWTLGGGLELLGGYQGGTPSISGDTSTIAAEAVDPNTNLRTAAIWQSGITWRNLGGIPGGLPSGNSLSATYGTNADGSVIVGLGWIDAGSAHAFRWTEGTGMVDLGSTVPGRSSRANGVSGDGNVVVGWQDRSDGFRQGAMWENGVQTTLFVTPNNDPAGEAQACTSDGSVVVGQSADGEAWRWTRAGGLEKLGVLPGFNWRGYFSDVSEDGTMAVGFSGFGFDRSAHIWVEGQALQPLADWFTAQGGVLPPGITLGSAYRISDDGRVIVGSTSSFPSQGFVIDLGPLPCYADCDTSTGLGVLDIFDFLCFQNRYAMGSPYACECDTSTGTGVCDIFDFLCFQNAFAAGCP